MSTLKVPVNPRDHGRGGPNAAVTLVEYGDYQCPYCAAAYPVVRFLESRFGSALFVVFRHFPLVEIHPLAAPAAEGIRLRDQRINVGRAAHPSTV